MKRKSRQIICAGFAIAVGLAVFHAGPAFAQAAAPDSSGALTKALADVSGEGRPLSLSLQILVLMRLLTVLPSLILMMTRFTRIIIVLSLLRQDLGLTHTPPTQVTVGILPVLFHLVILPE